MCAPLADVSGHGAGPRHRRSFSNVLKPKALVVHTLETPSGLNEMVALREECRERGVAFYPSVYRAALAISRYIGYHERR